MDKAQKFSNLKNTETSIVILEANKELLSKFREIHEIRLPDLMREQLARIFVIIQALS
jgi:hypothetical protein